MSVQPSAERRSYDTGYDPYEYRDRGHGDGWLAFAGVLIGIAAFLNVVGGIAAIGDSKFYVKNAEYVIGSLHTWGWIVLAIGVLEFLVAWGIFARNQLARWTGAFILALNSIAQLLLLPAYPLWALSIFTLNIMAMYGLIVYGARLTER